ncbi:SHOCT domain-containing protein [Aquirufa regiilacus]
MKVLSIIGIVWFSLCFVFIAAFAKNNLLAAAGWGIFGLMYAIPYSIVGLVKSRNGNNVYRNFSEELKILAELKEKGILSEDEFQFKKKQLLNA